MSSSGRARKLFIQAFSGEIGIPAWIDSIEITEPPHTGAHCIAKARFNTKTAYIKVLGTPGAVRAFRNDYPNADVLTLVVSERDTFEDIRRNTYELLSNYR